MNILLAINNLATGGAESFVCRLAYKLAELNHTVFLWQIFYPIKEHRYTDQINHPNIIPFEFEQFKIQTLINKPKSIRSILYKRQLNQKIKSLKIEIVNSHLFESDCFIDKNVKLPHVVSMHGSYEMYLNNPDIYKKDSIFKEEDFIRLCKSIFSNSKAVITITNKNRIIFKYAVDPQIVKNIYLGYQRQYVKLYDRSNIKSIGMLARGIETKGWEIAIDACIEARKKTGHNFTLTLGFTSSEYMNQLLKKYRNNHPWINWLENVTDLADFFGKIDLMLFPTQYPAESLPNVVIESLAYHVPVISTDIGEIKKMLWSNSGMAGVVFPEKSTKTELTNLIEKEIIQMISDFNYYDSVKKNCENAFEKFNLNNTAKQYLDVFQQAVNA